MSLEGDEPQFEPLEPPAEPPAEPLAESNDEAKTRDLDSEDDTDGR